MSKFAVILSGVFLLFIANICEILILNKKDLLFKKPGKYLCLELFVAGMLILWLSVTLNL